MKKEPSVQQSMKPRRYVVELKPSDYQPSKAEKEEELDMPGASLETVRRAFFRPLAIRRTETE